MMPSFLDFASDPVFLLRQVMERQPPGPRGLFDPPKGPNLGGGGFTPRIIQGGGQKTQHIDFQTGKPLNRRQLPRELREMPQRTDQEKYEFALETQRYIKGLRQSLAEARAKGNVFWIQHWSAVLEGLLEP